MGMRRIPASEVHRKAVAGLGLDPDVVDLSSPEALAACIRRAAGFLCPCPPKTLVTSVVHSLNGLIAEDGELEDSVDQTLESLVAYGDLIQGREAETEHAQGSLLLYTAPPAFVCRQSGLVFLIGIAPDDISPLPEELANRVEYAFHARHLHPVPGEDLESCLGQLGLIELSLNAWLGEPLVDSPAQYLARFNAALDSAGPAGTLAGVEVIDPSRPVRYYKGRWLKPSAQSGRFVARRSQAYGADLWCYLELGSGNPSKLLDLPTTEGDLRGCDEAWHLQAAIDMMRGQPQQFRLRPGQTSGAKIIDFFSPVPLCARRRWDYIGRPAIADHCLFSYCFSTGELDEELAFIRKQLWLAQV